MAALWRQKQEDHLEFEASLGYEEASLGYKEASLGYKEVSLGYVA